MTKFTKIWFLLALPLGAAIIFCMMNLEILPIDQITVLMAKETEAKIETEPAPDASGLIAHIQIPDSAIDEDIFYTKDDFYIDHNRAGEKDLKGEVFMQAPNSPDFTDPVTIIYGHNFHKGDEMFSPLCSYKDAAYAQSHPYIYIDTGEKTLIFQVIAAYTYDSRNILKSIDFYDKATLQAYFSYVVSPKAGGVLSQGATLNPETDKLLQLSTCVNASDTKSERFIVSAKLIGETN